MFQAKRRLKIKTTAINGWWMTPFAPFWRGRLTGIFFCFPSLSLNRKKLARLCFLTHTHISHCFFLLPGRFIWTDSSERARRFQFFFFLSGIDVPEFHLLSCVFIQLPRVRLTSPMEPSGSTILNVSGNIFLKFLIDRQAHKSFASIYKAHAPSTILLETRR